MQYEARTDQHAEISSQLTLWGQRGSQVIRGNSLIIPITSSLLYVEPLYLQATESRMPELKKVIVASGDRLVWDDEFQGALEKLVSGYEALAPTSKKVERGFIPRLSSDLISSALKHMKKYKELVGKGKFKEAGEELYKLENNLKEAVKEK